MCEMVARLICLNYYSIIKVTKRLTTNYIKNILLFYLYQVVTDYIGDEGNV